MPLSERVRAEIAAIRADETHGASWLARESLGTIGHCAEDSRDDTAGDLLEQVHDCARELIDARPGMAPVRFWLEQLLADANETAGPDLRREALCAAIVRRTAELSRRSEQAGLHAALNAANRLPDDTVIFTATYSGTILEACRLAGQSGKLRHLLIGETSDPGGHRYGQLFVAALAADGITAEVVPDTAIPTRVVEADRIWLGADAILGDGSVLNGMPSGLLARSARQNGRPVEIICESAKIEPSSSELGESEAVVVPPGMDRVPRELLSTVITEVGDGFLPAFLVGHIAARLVERGEALAVVESATGGAISDALTDRPGSSAWFAGGLVAYSNDGKTKVAGVAPALLTENGVVSAETARTFAERARRVFGVAWGIGETGIAGPQTGRRSAKPAGLAYVAVSGPAERQEVREVRTGLDDRAENKAAFSVAALTLLLDELRGSA